jgi:Protein of unknown function (DUF2946)
MYRFGIWLIAVAFVFNGAASYAMIDAPVAPILFAQGHHDAAASADHGAHSDEVAAAATDHGQAHDYAHNHLKCCGICNVASLLPDVIAVPVAFSYATVTFRTLQNDLVGHLVALDPDIPKTIV